MEDTNNDFNEDEFEEEEYVNSRGVHRVSDPQWKIHGETPTDRVIYEYMRKKGYLVKNLNEGGIDLNVEGEKRDHDRDYQLYFCPSNMPGDKRQTYSNEGETAIYAQIFVEEECETHADYFSFTGEDTEDGLEKLVKFGLAGMVAGHHDIEVDYLCDGTYSCLFLLGYPKTTADVDRLIEAVRHYDKLANSENVSRIASSLEQKFNEEINGVEL